MIQRRLGLRTAAVAVVAVAGLFAVASAIVSSRATDAGTRPFSRVGNPGRRFEGSDRMMAAFRRSGARSVTVMATVGSRRFYRLTTVRGTCYGLGPVTSSRAPLDVLACRTRFPDMSQPVLDLSYLEAPASSHGLGPRRLHGVHVVRVQGFAADGVARVLVYRTGRLVATAPVRDNVYELERVPPRVDELRWQASGGAIVFRQVFPWASDAPSSG
jgi:hypothetical protein